MSGSVLDSPITLSACVNHPTGLAHPSDKDHAKRKFSELEAQGAVAVYRAASDVEVK
jgi:hypothetical protein